MRRDAVGESSSLSGGVRDHLVTGAFGTEDSAVAVQIRVVAFGNVV